jgi:transposase-like protein
MLRKYISAYNNATHLFLKIDFRGRREYGVYERSIGRDTEGLRGPDDFYGPEGIVKQLAKAPAERTMEAELAGHPGYEKHNEDKKPSENRRNGKTGKTRRTGQGPRAIQVPRDREGSFEPRIAPKHQREFRGFDDKILSMYALGLTARQIQDHLKETVPPELISRAAGEVKELAA